MHLVLCSTCISLYNATRAVYCSNFRSGLRLLPHNAKMHYNFANLQKDLGNTEKAIFHYRIALE